MGDEKNRVINPQDLEHLAKLLDGRGGLEDKIAEAFTRASTLGVSGKLGPIKPMRTWVATTAPDMRRRASLIRAASGDPFGGLMWAGFSSEELKGKKIPPETLLVANAAVTDGGDTGWLDRKDGESLDDWIVRIQGDAVGKIAGNPEFGKAVSGYIEGTANLAAFFTSAGVGVMGTIKIAKYLKNSKIPNIPISEKALHSPGTFASKLVNNNWYRLSSVPRVGSYFSSAPPGLVTALTGSDEAAMLGGHMKNGTFFMPSASQANLLTVAKNGGIGSAARAAGWMRGAGVVGSAAATAWGVANLATTDPVAAIKKDPAGYASDVAGTAFNGSLTLALIAPSPVTWGIAAGTGLVYAGTLIWDNADKIAAGASTAKEWVGNAAEKTGEAISDGAKEVGNFLNPFD
ncbi:hypothetical protein [Streptomyces flaveus]|uniref:Mucin-2 n=1 Tax=Streptomyces flaveus TaxID=66370 RepID=A0A917RC01_9ACTN|nr:hypothetical protein [Streptomyces flaveus]GGL00834.1 hypothetical protein GCM10010094_71890 [Streptomyces flaveus]